MSDDFEPYERKRKRPLGIIIFSAAIGALSLAALLAIVYLVSAPPDRIPVESSAKAASNLAVIGDVEVSILGVGRPSVLFSVYGKDRQAVMTTIRVRITNKSKTLVTRFIGWQGSAELEDEHGNKFLPIEFPLGFDGFLGANDYFDPACNSTAIVAKNLPLHPGQCYTTYLFFEPMAVGSKEARISAPKSALGSSGTVNFKILLQR